MTDDDIYNFRYPFESIIDFFSGQYFLQLEALHLTLGFLFIVWGTWRIFNTNLAFYQKACLVYFLGSIFTNYCYILFGVSYSEWFGIMAFIGAIAYGKIDRNVIVAYMLGFAFISLLHLIIILPIYNWNMSNIEMASRMVPTLRIFVIAINSGIFICLLKSEITTEKLYKLFVPFLGAAIAVYYTQIAVFLMGTLPYGSFSPAGWTASPLPSFGSVAIERGHFGKFLVPLFPLVLYFWIKLGYRIIPILFLTVCLINLSASSLSFFAVFVILSTIFLSYFARTLFVITYTFLIAVSLVFSEQIITLIMKINDFAVVGEDEGGRSFDLFFLIHQRFPLGYGYGGSSFRNEHGFDLDLNNAIVAYGGMLSYAGIPILMIFGFMLWQLGKLAISKNQTMPIEARVMIVSLLGICFIFCADILWFVPDVWLPVLVMYGVLVRGSEQPSLAQNPQAPYSPPLIDLARP